MKPQTLTWGSRVLPVTFEPTPEGIAFLIRGKAAGAPDRTARSRRTDLRTNRENCQKREREEWPVDAPFSEVDG